MKISCSDGAVIDDPEHEDFCLHVVDVFVLTGRGVVVTGPIESGSLRTGDLVEIWDGEQVVASAEATVELICSRTADPRTIALRLGDLDPAFLGPGQIVRKRRVR